MSLPLSKRRSQEKIVTELREAFSNATSCDICALADDAQLVTLELVAADCKSRKVNVFRIGIRGGLRVIKQEFTAQD